MFLFAWLVLFGACYGFKKNIHIGVDILIHYLPPGWKYGMAILAGFFSIAFAGLLAAGSWQYWWPFITERVWLETIDIPMPSILRFIEPLLNEGEAYEKMPRFIPYAALPLSMSLLLFRSCHATWQIITKQRAGVIAEHDLEVDAALAQTYSGKEEHGKSEAAK